MYTITSNHLGTPTSMIDETGKKVWEETFDLWGKPHDRLETRVVGGAILTNVKPREANKNQAISQPFRFPGQYHDEETGLYYNRYRYYMPNEGMYTQRDPIGLAGGNPTVYGYVFDTLKHIDPFGLNASRDLPRLQGNSVSNVERILDLNGFIRTKNNGINQTWSHADGSEVRVHSYGNKNTALFRSANNAHVHRQDPSGNQLTDRGIVSKNPNETHIGIKNPKNLPTVRGRNHGMGCK